MLQYISEWSVNCDENRRMVGVRQNVVTNRLSGLRGLLGYPAAPAPAVL